MKYLLAMSVLLLMGCSSVEKPYDEIELHDLLLRDADTYAEETKLPDNYEELNVG